MGQPPGTTSPSVAAEQDRAIVPEQEANTAKRMGATILTPASSHFSMLSHPDKVAQFVMEAAGSIEVSAAAGLEAF